MPTDDRLVRSRFPRASAYHPDWVVAGVGGAANPLWLTEWLCESLDLKPGMRVLDLGCGRGLSSVFLRREFGVQVWAVDLWFDPAERLRRIRDAGVEDGAFPLRADARSLPFAPDFFDAVVSIDSFFYYGTDDHYLNYLARFVKPGGPIGIAGAAMIQDVDAVPDQLRAWWTPDCWCLHSAAWWRRHWEKTGFVTVDKADTLPDGWIYWRDWLKLIAPENTTEIAAVEGDAGQYFGYVRCVGRRRPDAALQDPVTTVPVEYVKMSLLRS
jgi:cyclopropane fatty-acyl-phospholipid synthase-like methyltransferase